MSLDWSTQLGTVVGASVGIAATLLADRLRWRRHKTDEWQHTRRQLYAEYLAGLTEAHGAMRAVAYETQTITKEHPVRVREAFRESGVYSMRYQVSLIAPASVVAEADHAFRTLRDVRNLLADGRTIESAEYKEKIVEYGHDLARLRNAMRADLGVSPLD